MEQLGERQVGVVIDPIQSVKGKVVIDCFRNIKKEVIMSGGKIEPRQTTSNIGHIEKDSIVARRRGLNKHYYSIVINYRKNEFEQKMLANLDKPGWSQNFKMIDFKKQHEENLEQLKSLEKLTKDYKKWIQEETKQTPQEFIVSSVGKLNPVKHLHKELEEFQHSNVTNCLTTMLNTVVF